MKITKHAHLTYTDANKFFDKLHETIDEYQQDQLKVEVQYQATANIGYSAYVIGREVE